MIPYTRTRPAPPAEDAVSHMVRMRDGIRLATDVYQPQDRSSPGPTVLIRLPYDKVGDYTYIPRIARYMSAHGYRVVAQDVRGKFRSEGETLVWVNEVNDGYDTLEWISQQPWSDGSVGMWGDSYYGFTQWAAVSSGHPALKAISPRVTGTRLGERPHLLPGEVTRDVEMNIALTYNLTHFLTNDTFDWEPRWDQRPYVQWVEEFVAEVGQRSPSFDSQYPHPVPLRRFPDGHPLDGPAVPTLLTIGWWDNCAPWSWADYELILARPHWALNTFLRIEPTDHENYVLDDPYRQEHRSEAALETVTRLAVDPTLQFFDVFLRGTDAATSLPRVSWHLAGTNDERTAAAWPPPEATQLVLHAHQDGTLADVAPSKEEWNSWCHDPDDLVPSTATNPFAFLLESPDETVLDGRNDVLVFTSRPFAHDTDLTGKVRATISASSTGPNMDLFVRLIDVAPDGRGLRIARGAVHIADTSTQQVLDLDMGSVGYRLTAGHSLRVQVASSDAPEYIAQPGTGEDPWSAVDTAVNVQRVLLGGEHGLRVRVDVWNESWPR